MEDLSQGAKDAQSKLWPLVKQARKDEKKKWFQRPFAYINGKRLTVNNV